VYKETDPRDNREVLVSLTRTGLMAHDAVVAGALERNQRLLQGLSKEDLTSLLAHIDDLTGTAAQMLAAEKDLS
jgi:DNA-binding MarR family transcriptional regulator